MKNGLRRSHIAALWQLEGGSPFFIFHSSFNRLFILHLTSYTITLFLPFSLNNVIVQDLFITGLSALFRFYTEKILPYQ